MDTAISQRGRSLALAVHQRQVATWRHVVQNERRILAAYARVNIAHSDNMQSAKLQTEQNIAEYALGKQIAGYAPTFALDHDIAAAIGVAARGVPLESELREEDILEPMGFLWASDTLDIPPWTPDYATGEPAPPMVIQGFSWKVIDTIKGMHEDEFSRGVQIQFMGPSENYSAAYLTGEPALKNVAVNCYSITWRFGDSMERWKERALSFRYEYDLEPWHVDDAALDRARFVYTFWRFVQQRVLTRTRDYGTRTMQREAKRLKWPGNPVIDIVELRRSAPNHNGSSEEEHVEWSCRWLVNGHWRRQYYRSTNTYETIWIAPYVKGPDDKPLRIKGHRTYVVTR